MNNSNSKRKLINIIYYVMKKLNKQSNLNIDFERTNKDFIANQIKPKFIKRFTEAYNLNELKDDNNIILFFNKNQTYIKNITCFTCNSNQTLFFKTIISKFLKNSQKNIISNKLFYFYFNLLLIEKLHKENNVSRDTLKKRIEEIINNKCINEKKKLLSCLLENRKDITIVPINRFEKDIDKKCTSHKKKLENCIRIPTQLSLSTSYN